MNLTDVIESLVEELGLPREEVVDAICEGVKSAYSRKFPDMAVSAAFNKKQGRLEVFVQKTVVNTVTDEDKEISLRKARSLSSTTELGDIVDVPLEEAIGRIEILAAKQIISSRIRDLERRAIFREFKSKEGSIVSGMTHKRERGGIVIKLGEIMAILPNAGMIPAEAIRMGVPIRCLLKEVLEVPRGGYQLILDRASSLFVQRLIELEIPEVFEGIVEVKRVVRIAGYKTKVVVISHNKDIDAVGTCVGVDGVRIKPILREINGEKIDLIQATESLEFFVKQALKPAEIDKVEFLEDGVATVWLSADQRSLAIGKMGRNIALASELAGVTIKLQEEGDKSLDISSFDTANSRSNHES